MPQIPSTILREYDIRGLAYEELSLPVMRSLGQAFGSRIVAEGGQTAVVGRDGRLSSPELETAFAEGLMACGLAVTSVGLGPTPMLYFASHVLHADGAAMITGSHNPANYNGIKMMLGGQPFFGADIKALGSAVAAQNYRHTGRPGRMVEAPISDDYIGRLLQAVDPAGRRLNVVWDCGNGAAGEVVSLLAGSLPGRHTVLFGDIDGRFPHHHPDPTEPENLEALREAVAAAGADFGVAFDGDGDRIGVVDAGGRILWGDQLVLLFAEELLRQQPGASIIFDVKATSLLSEGIVAAGGRPVMYKTGHSLIKTHMKRLDAPLAGEMSGHIFFADRWYGFDDAIYAAVRLLNLVATAEPGWLERRIDRLPPTWNTPEVRLDCPDERKFEVVAGLKAALQRDGSHFVDIDGVRVESAGGWWLVRASNTQPVLVARCEGRSLEDLQRQKERLARYMTELGIAVPAILRE